MQTLDAYRKLSSSVLESSFLSEFSSPRHIMDFGLTSCWHVCTTVLGCLYAMQGSVFRVPRLVDVLCSPLCEAMFEALCASVRAPKSDL